MKRIRKIALAFVISTSLAIVLTVIAVTILYFKFGMPKALYGVGMIGFAGLGGIASPFIRKDKEKVIFDERDALVKEKAALIGFTAAFLFTGLACMIPFFILGPKASIFVVWLPQIWMGTFITQFFFYSLAILIQYGRENKGENL